MKKKTSKAIVALLALIFLLLPIEALATDMETPAIEMEDVSPDDWFYRYVVDGLRFGIITGVSGDTFRFVPDRNVTRGEFITMLGRLHEYGHGTIGTPGVGPFYQRYLEWAVEIGIVQGNQHGDLMPRALVNREQMVVILYRYFYVFDLWDYVRFDDFTTAMLYRDHMEISDWARRPVEIFRTDFMLFSRRGYFRPHHIITRAEALQILAQTSYAIYELGHPMTR